MRENLERSVVDHYAVSGLSQRIFGALAAAGVDTARVKPANLAGTDEFHIGGHAETDRALGKLRLTPAHHVLDIGSGIGGPARHIALQTGCSVTGVDITPEFTTVAQQLSDAMGLSERTRFITGSALAMPFDAASFDAAITFHVAMNIEDRAGLYAETARVLKPGAQFCVYDVMKGPGGPLRYPVPWSTVPETSFLTTPAETREYLERAGFIVEESDDRTADGIAFFRQRLAGSAPKSPAPNLGLPLLVGPDAKIKFGNLAKGLEDGAVVAVMMLARRAS